MMFIFLTKLLLNFSDLMGSDQAMLLRFIGYHLQNARSEVFDCHFHTPRQLLMYLSGREKGVRVSQGKDTYCSTTRVDSPKMSLDN